MPVAPDNHDAHDYIVDDMGYGDPQCFNPQTKIATPDIRTPA